MGADSDGIAEKPLHHVKLTTPYEIGVNEVTQEQYQSIMGTNPSKFKGLENPVEMVSWNDAIQFCQKLSELPKEKESGFVYRLPTEAEWEYACRAGTMTLFSYGDSDTELSEYAWYIKNSNGMTHPVGQKKPNPWGLYDMHGNVWEWCQDWYGDYSGDAVTDPKGPFTGLLRVNRGGSWRINSGFCHSAIRYGNSPGDSKFNVGFRVVRTSTQQVVRAENTGAASTTEKMVLKTSQQSTPPVSDEVIFNSIKMQFKLLPAGTFMMGSRFGESDEQPVHGVILKKPFTIGVYEVTQSQFEGIMGVNPSKYQSPSNPVEQVSWLAAIEFCRKLSDLPKEKAAGYEYRLPTEAEWEYACRSGSMTKYNFGDQTGQLGNYSWYLKNSRDRTHPIGQKKPNIWGLYDMNGNVWEWCQDWFAIYPDETVIDPVGPSSGQFRILRGGSWSSESMKCRSADRFWHEPDKVFRDLGFRVIQVSKANGSDNSQVVPESVASPQK